MDTINLFEYETCENYSTWFPVVTSITLWSVCYLVVQKIFHQKSPEWCIRIVTLMHGCCSAVTGLSECATTNFFATWNKPQTQNQQMVLLVSLGYFTFDLMWCLYYQTESKVMLLHHVLSTVGLYRVLHNNYAGSQTCCAVGGMEVTNPLLQLRWFIRDNDVDKIWFVYADIIFAICFFIMRCGFGTYFFVNIVFAHDFAREYILYTTILYLISWLFVVNIVQYLYVKYRKRENSKSNVNVNAAGQNTNERRPTINVTS